MQQQWLKRFWKLIQKGRGVLLAVGLAVSLLFTISYAVRPIFFRYLDDKLYDSMMRSAHSVDTSDIPAIVDIDEKSLLEIGQWPWPRYRIARLLEKIKELGATSVALDMVFSEPDRTSLSVLSKEMLSERNVRMNFKGLSEELLDNDKTLAKTLENGPYVLGYHFNFEPSQDSAPEDCVLHPLHLSVMGGADSQPVEQVFYEAPAVVCNKPVLSNVVSESGFFNALPDADGVIRHAPLIIRYEDNFYPSLALAAYLRAFPTKQIILWLRPTPKEGQEPPSLQVGDKLIPLDAHGRMIINFHGPRETYPYYSATDILNDRLPPETFAGKIIFIGTSAAGLKDIRTTPLDQVYPGVEVHAATLDNILQQDYMHNPAILKNIEVMLTFLLGILSTLLLAWASALWSLLPLGLCVGGIWYGADWLFRSQGMFISPLIPTLTLAINFMLLTLLKFWREEGQRRFFHQAFSQYVSKAVVEEIVKSPERLSLSGEEREVSILFSDIRSFTSMSEKLHPNQVSELLHAYFTPMTAEITATNGTLDKFIGDAIMAFWNAPLNTPQHQKKAVDSAVGMLHALDRLNPYFKEKFNLELAIGIGLHCGTVRVGNMGSKDLFDYTIIGDSVNLASRLEGLTKFYGVGIVLSETIREACLMDTTATPMYFQELDTVRVKGKALPISIYTPYSEEQRQIHAAELEKYEEALQLYKEQQFSAAQNMFADLRQNHRDMKLYAAYQERCMQLQASPPGEGWDFVFTHSSK